MGNIWAAPSQMFNATNRPETLVWRNSLAKVLPRCQGFDLCRVKLPALGSSRYWSTLGTRGSFDGWWRKSCAGGSGRVSGKHNCFMLALTSVFLTVSSEAVLTIFNWLQQLKRNAVFSVNWRSKLNLVSIMFPWQHFACLFYIVERRVWVQTWLYVPWKLQVKIFKTELKQLCTATADWYILFGGISILILNVSHFRLIVDY